jgi:hypothetical protein
MMGRGGSAGRGGGGGVRLSKEERASPFAKVKEGVWLKAKDGRATWSIIFNPIQRDANGDAYRPYGYSWSQKSRSTRGSGNIRLKDGLDISLNRDGVPVGRPMSPASGVRLVLGL